MNYMFKKLVMLLEYPNLNYLIIKKKNIVLPSIINYVISFSDTIHLSFYINLYTIIKKCHTITYQ